MKLSWYDLIYKMDSAEPHCSESIVGVHDAVNHKVHHHEPDMRYNVFIR